MANERKINKKTYSTMLNKNNNDDIIIDNQQQQQSLNVASSQTPKKLNLINLTSPNEDINKNNLNNNNHHHHHERSNNNNIIIINRNVSSSLWSFKNANRLSSFQTSKKEQINLKEKKRHDDLAIKENKRMTFKPTVVPSHSPDPTSTTTMPLILQQQQQQQQLNSNDENPDLMQIAANQNHQDPTNIMKTYSTLKSLILNQQQQQQQQNMSEDDLINHIIDKYKFDLEIAARFNNNNNNNANNCNEIEISAASTTTTSNSNKLSSLMNKPISNGFLVHKVNPSLTGDMAYLSRNLLVNRRLIIRKQAENSFGLKPISPPPLTKPYVATTATSSTNQIRQQQQHQLQELNHQNNDDHDHNHNHNEELIQEEEEEEEKKKKKKSQMMMMAKLNKLNRLLNKSASNSQLIDNNNNSKSKFKTRELVDVSAADGAGLTPQSYHVPRRPPNERIAPMFTFGARNLNEKKGGGRTSWEKEWFTSKNPFTKKTDFKRESTWPAPNNYNVKSIIGDQNQLVYHKAPMHSMGQKLKSSPLSNYNENNENDENNNNTFNSKKRCHRANNDSATTNSNRRFLYYFDYMGDKDDDDDDDEHDENKSSLINSSDHQHQHHLSDSNRKLERSYIIAEQSINEMERAHLRTMPSFSNMLALRHSQQKHADVHKSFKYANRSAPKITIQPSRQNGTELWPKTEETPGPGAYEHKKFSYISRARPKFSLPHTKILGSNYLMGPFAST